MNEELAAHEKFAELHPCQDLDTVQGILEIYYRFEQIMKEVSGMDRVTFQPGGGGNHAVYTAASVVRAYWEEKGQLDQRNEVITTIFPTHVTRPPRLQQVSKSLPYILTKMVSPTSKH